MVFMGGQVIIYFSCDPDTFEAVKSKAAEYDQQYNKDAKNIILDQ
jgi:hypothetical protein